MQSESARRSIEFYFDPVSPYVWLAASQLQQLINQTAARIELKPVLFAGLLKANDHKGPAEIPAKRKYTFRDVMRRALRYNLSLEGPPAHPFNPLLSLRICTAIDDHELRLKFACLVADAAWAKGADITRPETISKLAQQCNLNPDWALSMAEDPIIKEKLAEETQAAIELGVFGVPTFRIDDQIFWGEDRIEDIVQYINGQEIDEAKLNEILNREVLVRRS